MIFKMLYFQKMWQIFAASVDMLVTEKKKNNKPWKSAVIFVLLSQVFLFIQSLSSVALFYNTV